MQENSSETVDKAVPEDTETVDKTVPEIMGKSVLDSVDVVDKNLLEAENNLQEAEKFVAALCLAGEKR